MSANDRHTVPPDPRGWVQWKGTSACVDIHCLCGELTHIDGDFLYHVKCCVCGRAYSLNGNIQLVPLTPEEAEEVEADGGMHETTED